MDHGRSARGGLLGLRAPCEEAGHEPVLQLDVLAQGTSDVGILMDLSGIESTQLAWLLAEEETRRAHAVWEATKAAEEVGRIKAELAKRLTPGEVLAVDDHVQVVCLPAKPNGRRSVDRDAIHAHIETLGPLGLGPVEEAKVTYRYPSVSELERQTYRLARCGIEVETLIDTPPLGELRIEVQERKAVA